MKNPNSAALFACLALCACSAAGPGPSGGGGALTLTGGAPAHSPSADVQPAYRLDELKAVPEGRYRAVVSGVLCNACTRAIVENLKALKGMESASFDFEEGILWFTVAKGKSLRPSHIRRALKRAGKRVKLDTRFEITELRYAK
ncbi:MAG: heavy-metal-associated domain-containing protein [Elusimicrobiota bacterium]